MEALNTKETAIILRCTPRTVQNLIDGGQLPGFRLGRDYRVRRQDLEAWMARGGTLARGDEARR